MQCESKQLFSNQATLFDGKSLAGGGDKSKRRELDFYPTPSDVTTALLRFLDLSPRTIWEPACGDGAMSRVIEASGHTVISTDLRNTGFGEGGCDFLTQAPWPCDAVVTNPPFSTSELFIRKALEVAPTVAMLLKSQYWHAQKRQVLFRQHPPTWVLPLTWRPDFLNGERGGAPTMECLWTVWVRGECDTRFRTLPRPT